MTAMIASDRIVTSRPHRNFFSLVWRPCFGLAAGRADRTPPLDAWVARCAGCLAGL